MIDRISELDLDRVISTYREVITTRDCMRSPEIRADYEAVASSLRRIWRQQRGADTLHQTAFGDALVAQHFD